MSWYQEYKLVKENNDYTLVLYLNPDSPEFSKELFGNFKENLLDLDDEIRSLVKEKFKDIKVNSVKLMLGSLVVASIPFMGVTKVHAAETAPTPTTQTVTQTTAAALNTTGTVTATQLNVRSGASTSYAAFHQIYQGNIVKVIGQTTGWYKIQLSDGRIGWVSSSFIRLASQVDIRQQKIDLVISTAKSFLGTPYVWGGESPSEGGFDCSGFTQYSFKQAGYMLNRISSDQAKQGIPVAREHLQRGDLVFASLAGDGRISHVGIYLGEGKMIHSPKTGDVVKITDITTYFWQSRYITARRII